MDFLKTIPTPSKEWDSTKAIAFYIGSLGVAWYGIFVTLGFAAAIILAVIKLSKWYKVSVDPFYYYCLIGIPAAIIGARFWSYCIGDAHDWSQFFQLRTGGLAIQGGVTCDIIIALWWFPYILSKPKYQQRINLGEGNDHVKQVSMWVYADAIIPCILMGQVIGRYGNYFNQEVYGSMINEGQEGYLNFLAKVFPFMYKSGAYYHPLFLYESCINFIGFILLYIIFELIANRKAGTSGIAYILWYGLVRVALEPLRDHQFNFMMTYVMVGLWIVIGILLIVLNETNIIAKTRPYKCKYFILNSLKYSFLKSIYSSKPQGKQYAEKLKLVHSKTKRTKQEFLHYLGR